MAKKIIFLSNKEAAKVLTEYKEKYNIESDIVDRVIKKLQRCPDERL